MAAELRYRVEKRRSPRLKTQVEAVLRALEILTFAPPADLVYGRLRAHLDRQGHLIDGNDLQIAAHALSADLVIVTDNEREFSRVPALRWENWIRGGIV